jgi:SAM-dependent methyltransferase
MNRKEKFYLEVADRFDELMDPYDIERRIDIVFQDLLPSSLRGKLVLDAGAGTGYFSQMAADRGARVISVDVGTPLLAQVAKRTAALLAAGDVQALPFRKASFDVVISSEVIEHTLDPAQAVRELARVLKPGGILALTCPNRLWQPVVRVASRLRLRPYQGYENFPSFRKLDTYVLSSGLILKRHFGFHPWPFQFSPFRKLSRQVDLRFGHRLWGRYMINQAIQAVKAGVNEGHA